MCPYTRIKVVACSLSQLRKRELNYLTSYLKLTIVEHESTIFLEVQVTSRRITRIYRTSPPSWSWACDIFVGMKFEYDLEKWYHLEKQKSLSMSLARESYAKKIRTTPRIKRYIPSSSNLARNINVLKIGRIIFFWPRDSSGLRRKVDILKRIGIIGKVT